MCAMPIPGVPVSTPYGKRGSYWSCNEDANGNGIHTGVDFACSAGTDILAPIAGQIRHRNYGSSFGNHQFAISPDPGDPFGDGEVFFAHTTDRLADGVWVGVGDYLASVGAEGNVSGPHLHMEYHADTKGSWSCSVVDDPQPVLDYEPTPTNPTNPNNVKVGEKVVVTANGSLNGRSGPGSDYPVVTSKAEGATFVVKALVNGWASDTEQPSQVKTSENAPLIGGTEVTPTADLKATGTWATGKDVPPEKWLDGWDVSSNNPDSWQPAPEESFGWVKATEGKSYLNPDYDEQLKKARDDDQVVGHYHWLNSGSVTDQVNWFKSKADVRQGEMIAVDWENDTGTGTASCAQKDDAIAKLQAAYPHNRVGLYCNRDFWTNRDTTSQAGDYLWIAKYGGDDPGIEHEWLFWQYSDTPMDRNYGRFDSLATLRGWAAKVGTDNIVPPDPEPPEPEYVGNWFSTDYLDQYTEPVKPGWKSTPYKVLSMDNVPGSVSYLQGVMHVEAVTEDDGTQHASMWIVAQDYENSGDTRFLAFREDGSFINWFQVNDGGHAQTFYAYRSAAGNLYVWVGEDPAYRHAWQPGKKVSKTSGDKMDYKGSRPQGGYKDRIVFRNATDTEETFYLFDRTDFTDGTNRTDPIKSRKLTKDTSPTQQGWGANTDRIVRLRGSTNEDTEHNHDGLHRLDVYAWDGTCLLRDFDITDMHRSGCTEDEPEGVSFIDPIKGTGILAAKREGSASASKRDYVLWEMTGMP